MAKRNQFNRANIPVSADKDLTIKGFNIGTAKVKLTGSFNITGSVTHTGSHSTHGSGSMFKLKSLNPGATIEMGMHEHVFNFDDGTESVESTSGFIPANCIVHCISFYCTASLGANSNASDTGDETGIVAVGHPDAGNGGSYLSALGGDAGLRGSDFYFSASHVTGSDGGGTGMVALNTGDTWFVYPNASGSNFYTGSVGVLPSGSGALTGSEITVKVEPSTVTGSVVGVVYFTKFGPATDLT